MSQPNPKEKEPKKKKKRGLFHFTGKSKKKDKKDSKTKPIPIHMQSEDDPDSTPDDIATKPHLKRPTDDSKMAGNSAPTTEIDILVDKMTSILTKLGALNRADHMHSVDIERFRKLVEWVDYDESHFALLTEAWTDSSFWPFLSTAEATEQVRKDKETMLIRLSNTSAGAITVTRLAKMMKGNRLEEYVKHKRYFPSDQFGKLTLTGSWGERPVTYHGLLSYLKQMQCCICLEELTEDSTQNMVLRLNCGHHFHRHCIERHVKHSMQTNGTAFAVCPLCRKRIEAAELIKEPSLVVYKPIPDMAKSKSFDVLNPRSNHLNSNSNEQTIHRANTADLPPNTTNMDDALMLQMMQQGPNNMNNHPWNAFGNHLEVSKHQEVGNEDDDYASAAQVRRQYKMKLSNLNRTNANHNI